MMIGYQRQKHGLITLALVGLLVATSLRVWLGPLTLTRTHVHGEAFQFNEGVGTPDAN